MKRRNQEGILFMELPSFEQVVTRHQLGQTVEWRKQTRETHQARSKSWSRSLNDPWASPFSCLLLCIISFTFLPNYDTMTFQYQKVNSCSFLSSSQFLFSSSSSSSRNSQAFNRSKLQSLPQKSVLSLLPYSEFRNLIERLVFFSALLLQF